MRLLSVLLFLIATSVRADTWTWTVGQTVPDYDPGGLQNTQTVSGYEGVIESIAVQLHLKGDPLAYGGDLFVSLQSANESYAVLLNRVGRTTDDPFGYDTNGFDVSFVLGEPDIHSYLDYDYSYNTDGALTGTWGADARDVDPLDVVNTDARSRDLDQFTGINPNGEWTLFVADTGEYGIAQLESWGLYIVAVPEPKSLVLALILFSMFVITWWWSKRVE